MQVLTDNHYDQILNLFDGTTKRIKIISPFLSESMARKLCDAIKKSNIECEFITRFYLEDMFAKANSMDALERMIDAGIKVYALKGLHTKLYLFDDDYGVLGSANFTAGGFKSNVELSLLMDMEDSILCELHSYFDDLLTKIKQSKEGLVTKEVLAFARELYKETFDSKKGKVKTTSSFMYGASLDKKTIFGNPQDVSMELEKCKDEKDIVNSMFRSLEQQEQILYDHTIWLKFDGEGNDRLEAKENFPMIAVHSNGGIWYLSNYPFKVHSVKEDDEIYLAALTTDTKGKNQPVIVGRGYLAAFQEENYVRDEWIKEHSWMTRYPWYCVIKNAKVLDMPIEKGIPMDEIWDKLGSDTYMSSFGRNETIAAVAKKHHQKAHIRLSGNAKDYIDKRLDELEKQYGVMEYHSNAPNP